MRGSPIQSRSSRRDREFLTLTLRLRDETEKKFPPISGIETRSRFIIFILRLRDENENSLELISVFETRTRILKVTILVSESGLFLTLSSSTSGAQNKNLKPPLNRNIPPISGEYGLRNHLRPLESGFLMRKSEKKGDNLNLLIYIQNPHIESIQQLG